MEKKPNLAKQILINTLIPLLKTLIFLKKVITTFFLLLLIKPIKWLVLLFLYWPVTKFYGYYLLSLKKLRKIGLKNNPRLFLLKQFATPLTIIIILLYVLFNNLIAPSNFGELADKMYKSIIASLITGEFDSGAPEELIVETANIAATCSSTPEHYQNIGLALKPALKITTNTTPVDQNAGEACLVRNGESLVAPDILNTGQNATVVSGRQSVIEYTVKAGDNISSIARRFGISVNTVLWANNLSALSTIKQGAVLKILPQSGVLHKVVRGDTIQSIANKYKISGESIINANSLSAAGYLQVGQNLIIPGGQKITTATAGGNSYNAISIIKNIVKPTAAKPSSARMQWPTQGYRITQYYSARHTGLDVANKTGTPLYAADDGVVEKASWSTGGYGNMILVNHGGGLQTRYAHASKIYVRSGQTVSRGEVIGLMGSTGRSTGPHLHFEVILNGRRLNPLNYIR